MDLIDRQALLKQIDIDSDGEPGYYGDTWKFIDTIKSLPSATDKSVGTKLGTDLAEVGTDCISRQAAIEAVQNRHMMLSKEKVLLINDLEKLPSVQPETNCSEIPNSSTDCISRRAAIDALDMAIERYDEMAEEYQKKADIERNDYMDMRDNAYEAQQLAQWLNELKYLREKIEQITIKPEPHWIPCSERLPEDTRPVNITWVNREPEPYYAGIKDVPFTATGHYCKEKWYWYSATCQDYLDEYGECEVDAVDNMIEIIAWMPLPAPYKGGDTE